MGGANRVQLDKPGLRPGIFEWTVDGPEQERLFFPKFDSSPVFKDLCSGTRGKCEEQLGWKLGWIFLIKLGLDRSWKGVHDLNGCGKGMAILLNMGGLPNKWCGILWNSGGL